MANIIPTELHRYTLRDLASGLRIALMRTGPEMNVALPGLGNAIPVRSARAAIIFALRALDLLPGSRVGVPLYCCPVVFKAIKAAGCVPRFLDVDPRTFCVSAPDIQKKISEIDVLVAVHMFGNLCDMPRILDIMAGRPTIEDCAQSLGSRLADRSCGSFGHIAFFSFRSGKYLSAGEGGAVYSRDKKMLGKCSELVSCLPVPTLRDEIVHIMTTYVRSSLRSRPLWGIAGKKIWAAYNRKTDFIDKSPLVQGRMFASNLTIVRRRMPHLDSMIAIQRKHADYYHNNLSVEPDMICTEPNEHRLNRFMYPIIFPSTGARNKVAAYLDRYGIDSSRPYEDVIAGAESYFGYTQDCPTAERLLKSTLVIPSYYRLSRSTVEQITRRVNEAWFSARNLKASPF